MTEAVRNETEESKTPVVKASPRGITVINWHTFFPKFPKLNRFVGSVGIIIPISIAQVRRKLFEQLIYVFTRFAELRRKDIILRYPGFTIVRTCCLTTLQLRNGEPCSLLRSISYIRSPK